jgi:hypothetical protein
MNRAEEFNNAWTELKLLKAKAQIDAMLEGTKGTLAHFVLLHELQTAVEILSESRNGRDFTRRFNLWRRKRPLPEGWQEPITDEQWATFAEKGYWW